jgi:hypothetical protein
MREDQERQIIEDDPELCEDSFRHRKSPALIPFNNIIDKPISPDGKPQRSEEEKTSQKDEKNLLPS